MSSPTPQDHLIADAAPARPAPRQAGLIALLAMSMALAALGVDLILPAFGAIRADLGMATDATAVTGLITAYFLGLAAGQLAYGPIADRFGRRPTLFLGYGIYAVGALAGAVMPTLAGLFVARFVWGLGAAGPRVVTLAVIRDRWEGDRMARAMSFVLAVFVIVPVIAPTLGAGVVAVASWRTLFAGCVVAAAGMAVWAARRLPETLAPEHRRELRFRQVAAAARQVATHRQTVAYTLAMTALYGVFTSYLASAEAIYREVFDAGDVFPLLFGGLAAVMGVAMVVNATVVERVGTRRFAHAAVLGYMTGGGLMVAVAATTGGRPPLWLFMVTLAIMLGSHALLLPNFNSLAMEPMRAIAGTASSVIGGTQLAVGALLGALLDRTFNGTILPLAVGFLGYGTLAVALVIWGERGHMFPRPETNGSVSGPPAEQDPALADVATAPRR